MLQHLLREESIRIGLEAEDQILALKKMVNLLPSWGIELEDKSDLLIRLLNRERFGTTAIGGGIALPHCIFPGISLPLASLGISKEGICFPSLDGKPVHIMFLLVLPEHEDSDRMKDQILHHGSNFFRDPFWRERLKISTNPEEVYELIVRESNLDSVLTGAV